MADYTITTGEKDSETDEFVETDEAVDIPGVIGGDSQWTTDGDGNLVPKEGRPVNIPELSSLEKPFFIADDERDLETVAADANGTGGTIILASMDHETMDTVDLDNVTLLGNGDATIRATADAPSHSRTLRAGGDGVELYNLTIDSNIQNRAIDYEVGFAAFTRSHIRVENCEFLNFGDATGYGGSGIFIGFDTDGNGSVEDVRIKNVRFSPVEYADFGIRVRSEFGGDQTSRDEFADSVTDVVIEDPRFDGGRYKNCIEFSGPVTRNCHMVRPTATDVTVDQSHFAINYGPVECTAEKFKVKDGVYDGSGNPHGGFRLDGGSGWETFDCDITGIINGFNAPDLNDGDYLRGLVARSIFDSTVSVRVTGLEQTGGDHITGVQMDGENTTLRDSFVEAGDYAVTIAGGTDPNIENCTLNGGSEDVFTFGSPVRPRWNGVIRGGPDEIEGVDLSTVTGQYPGDKAMSDGTNTTAYTVATWTGSAWQPSEGGPTISP